MVAAAVNMVDNIADVVVVGSVNVIVVEVE